MLKSECLQFAWTALKTAPFRRRLTGSHSAQQGRRHGDHGSARDSTTSDLYVILGETRRQQRGVFDDRIILAVAATGSNSLEWSTPMVENAPSCVVTCRPNREINRSVDQANSGAAAFACTL